MGGYLVCVTLFVRRGHEGTFRRAEIDTLSVAARHGAQLIQAVRLAKEAKDLAAPYEFHLLSFPSKDAYHRFLADPERSALETLRQSAICQTVVATGVDCTGQYDVVDASRDARPRLPQGERLPTPPGAESPEAEGGAMSFEVRRLGPTDLSEMTALLDVFGRAFDQIDVYCEKRPRDGYLQELLGDESFIALIAQKDLEVVGGLVAYELKKFEQERSEIYIYDLAVLSQHRRQGIAAALIERLRNVGAAKGAHVLFVQADTGIEDQPAVALYSNLGLREEVLHFDIPVKPRRGEL